MQSISLVCIIAFLSLLLPTIAAPLIDSAARPVVHHHGYKRALAEHSPSTIGKVVNLHQSRDTTEASVDHPPYVISKWNRIYRNKDATPNVENHATEDPWAALDDVARAVVRDTAAMKPVLPSNLTLPTKTKRQDSDVFQAASVSKITVPRVQATNIIGSTINDPATQYINLPSQKLPVLPAADLTPGINFHVTEDYPGFYNGSGSLQLNSRTQRYLSSMQYQPVLGRDGGQGGTVNGAKLFIFDDTQTWSPSGIWCGFVSNSVAADYGNKAKAGQAPILQDKLGEFANSAGTMRNFIPFTLGEAAYNSVRAGLGQRFGIWPFSSIIPWGESSALLYAPIIYTNTAPGAQLLNYVGMTLVKITVPGAGGAIAERIAPMLVQGPGIEWGAIGGIRKLSIDDWTDGNENHGRVYIMGNAAGGLFLARVQAPQVADWGAYQFYHASTKSWSSTAPSASQTSDFFMTGEYSTADTFYSPKHRTFIMVYMTPYADNTVYWRYLQAPSAISPSDPGDYVANIAYHPWSPAQVLFKIPYGRSYAYAGGMYRGYFDGQDITEGGRMMLYGWTQPTVNKAPGQNLMHNVATVTWA